MSDLAIIPNIDPIQVLFGDDYTLVIKAAYHGQFVVSVLDKHGRYICIPDGFAVYDVYQQYYWYLDSDEKFHSGSLFNVYEFYYKNNKVLENTEYLTMEDYCGFPFTSNKYFQYFQTVLLYGNTIKNSTMVNVSSTLELDVGTTVFGEGIPPFATITRIDDDSNRIYISEPALDSCYNISITAR